MFRGKQRLGIFTVLATLAFLLSGSVTRAEEEQQEVDLFHKDSDFMKGFETGLFLRSKNGNVEEYGCTVPKDANMGVQAAFD